MVNPWFEHVKKFAKDNNISYACAVTKASASYTKKKDADVKKTNASSVLSVSKEQQIKDLEADLIKYRTIYENSFHTSAILGRIVKKSGRDGRKEPTHDPLPYNNTVISLSKLTNKLYPDLRSRNNIVAKHQRDFKKEVADDNKKYEANRAYELANPDPNYTPWNPAKKKLKGIKGLLI
ncbi:hypothetical protein T484DRAFT_1757666 [Baffinella frigidus]|nr:hypothetical protein T484DRAFT_1757666 [Cryptophyta sp. CCMP2293]